MKMIDNKKPVYISRKKIWLNLFVSFLLLFNYYV